MPKRFLKLLSISLASLFVSGFLLLFFSPKPSLLEEISFSQAIYDEEGKLLRLGLTKDEKYRLFIPLKNIAKELKTATLLEEDYYFYHHPGVNPIALFRAAWNTYVLHSRRIGASTISMQLARLRFGVASKSLGGKFIQLLHALELEWYYSKDELLEAYLNLAPYGSNIEGIGAASLIYFAKSAADLNLAESLTLSVIPQNPQARQHNNAILNQAKKHLLERWLTLHPEDKMKEASLNLPLAMKTKAELPFTAPHFVQSLRFKDRDQELKTTLNARLQGLIERITQAYIKRKQTLGVTNAAVLLVDSRNMEIKASLGSVDFSKVKISGAINGTEIKRSPGSTLKPFIYALALDQGLIHPHSILKDMPKHFGSYNPENFDYDFMGPIKAKDALILSRNIPALYLANQLKSPNLYQFLIEAQVQGLKSESFYGLAIALGAVELTMQELSALYAVLANEGLYHPLRRLKTDPRIQPKPILSAEASFLVLDMLKNTPRPKGYAPMTGGILAWKTGTSSGFRDAWSIGLVGPYVLNVWVGNFNNQANHAFVGKEIAAPLFFELAQAIQAEVGSVKPLRQSPLGLNLTQIDICKASGMLPTAFCKDREKTWFIPGKSPIKSDTIYREIAINPQTGLRTCHIDEKTRFEIYEFWPTDLLKLFKTAGIQRQNPPPFETSCQRYSKNSLKPQITSPQSHLSYILTKEQGDTIPLSTINDAEVKYVYWFINEAFLGKVPANKTLWWQAKPGHYIIRVVDDHGLADLKTLEVHMAH